jgi:hypothetical protein
LFSFDVLSVKSLRKNSPGPKDKISEEEKKKAEKEKKAEEKKKANKKKKAEEKKKAKEKKKKTDKKKKADKEKKKADKEKKKKDKPVNTAIVYKASLKGFELKFRILEEIEADVKLTAAQKREIIKAFDAY